MNTFEGVFCDKAPYLLNEDYVSGFLNRNPKNTATYPVSNSGIPKSVRPKRRGFQDCVNMLSVSKRARAAVPLVALRFDLLCLGDNAKTHGFRVLGMAAEQCAAVPAGSMLVIEVLWIVCPRVLKSTCLDGLNAFANLDELKLLEPEGPSFVGLNLARNSFSGLKNLRLVFLVGLTLEDLRVFEAVPQVRILRLAMCVVRDGLAPLARIWGLEHLDIIDCAGPELSASQLAKLAPLPALRHLWIDRRLGAFASDLLLHRFTHLRSVKVSGALRAGDRLPLGIEQLRVSCGQATTFNLEAHPRLKRITIDDSVNFM